jgi:large subunit ribosomal protein L25
MEPPVTDVTLTAQSRNEFGKGAARRIRRAKQIPAVMYGHGTDPVHITLPGHETALALKNPNALLTIVLDGKEQLALAKDVQRDAIKPVIDHIDLIVVRRGERVTVDVQVHVVGEAAPETVVTVETQALQLEVSASAIPQNVEVSVEGLAAGTQVHASDIPLPAGATLVTDPEILVVNVSGAITEEQLEAELAESEAELGIEHDPTDAEQAAEAEAAAEGDTAEGTGDVVPDTTTE